MRQPCPTGATVQQITNKCLSSDLYKNEGSAFNPFKSLMTALEYDKAVWSKVKTIPISEALPLLDLTFLLKEHIETLLELCSLNPSPNAVNSKEFSILSAFYQSPEVSIHHSKRGESLRKIFLTDNYKSNPVSADRYSNYYDSLFDELLEEETITTPIQLDTDQVVTNMTRTEHLTQASFPEDLDISEVTASIRHRQAVEMDEDVENDPQTNPIPNSPPKTTTITTAASLAPVKVCINLIRHKYAVSTDLTSLQLFKTFVLAAKRTDPSFIVLPIDSTKQELTSLVSIKQIENLTNNQLRLYFSSWFKDQPHSLSGFLHLNTNLSH